MYKKLVFFVITSLIFSICVVAQSSTELLQNATTLQKQLKEEEALQVYKQVLTSDETNMMALVKCAELSTSIGNRQRDKALRDQYFTEAKECADKALALDSNNADAIYVQALSFANASTTETENKKIVAAVKQIKHFADKGLSLDQNHALLNYMEGKWHLEMLDLNWLKKAALKTFYGDGLAQPDLDSAIYYLEKCRRLSPYFVQNYADLAKAYRMKNRPSDEIDVLTRLVKLPNRTADDAAIKEQGKKRLQELQ